MVRAYDRVAAQTAGRLLSGPRFAGALVLYLLLIALIKGQEGGSSSFPSRAKHFR